MPARLLTDPLPLRRASDLPEYRTDAILPWVYGRASVHPIAMDSAGRDWLLADHPITGVDWVELDGARTDGWQLLQTLDDTGHPVAILRLTQPPDDGVTPTAQLIGRRHPTTGAALEHPADIAADLLRACGWSIQSDAFQTLRDTYPGLALAVVYADATTLRAALAAIIEPLGATWTATPTAGGPAAHWPGTAPLAGTLDPQTTETIAAQTTRDGLATVARIAFARDWATGRPAQSLVLRAPEAIARWGEITVDLDLPMVRTARDALAIGTHRLQRLARPLWTITAEASSDVLTARLGDALTLAHPWAPTGTAQITAVQTDRERRATTYTLSLPAGPAPRVELARRGAAIDADATEPLQVVYRDGQATFTVTDPAGNSMSGAAVTLDGNTTRNTDRNGRVTFTAARGLHTLAIYRSGYAPLEQEIQL